MNALQGTEWGNKVVVEPIISKDGNPDLRVLSGATSSNIGREGWAEILHGLNNVLASMLLNAQVMEWKLPSYSRSRRYLHEIERIAQRGGELVKRLLGQLEAECPIASWEGRTSDEARSLDVADRPRRSQDAHAADRPLGMLLDSTTPPAVVTLSSRKRVPHTMV
jgi:hypothetical protein